jgi:hypothetical protein
MYDAVASSRSALLQVAEARGARVRPNKSTEGIIAAFWRLLCAVGSKMTACELVDLPNIISEGRERPRFVTENVKEGVEGLKSFRIPPGLDYIAGLKGLGS